MTPWKRIERLQADASRLHSVIYDIAYIAVDSLLSDEDARVKIQGVAWGVVDEPPIRDSETE